MRRVIELDLVTKSEANQRFASKAGMFAKSERVKAQRAAVTSELARHFGAQVPPLFVIDGNVSGPNKIAIKLTRIAPGTLDDDNLRGALKAVRDAVAKWIGIDDRNPIAAWNYEQRSAGQHVYRVEIEVVDRAPGNERIVRLAETGSEGRAAASRVKRAVSAQTRKESSVYTGTKIGRVSQSGKWSNRGRSLGSVLKAARKNTAAQDAEMLTKLRAQARSVLCPVQGCGAFVEAYITPASERECTNVNDEPFEYGVHVARARAAGCPPMPDVASLNRGERPQLGPGGDEDKSPRMLVPCPICAAAIGEPCVTPKSAQGRCTWAHGVHVERARLAGLTLAGSRVLAKAPTNGRRKLVAPASQPELPVMRAFAALPWEQPVCPACLGKVECGRETCICCDRTGRSTRGDGASLKLRPMPALDGLFPPPDIRMRVLPEHEPLYGMTITLARRRYESGATGVCWVYEVKEAKEGRTT